MSDKSFKERTEELNDFWDLDLLLGKRERRAERDDVKKAERTENTAPANASENKLCLVESDDPRERSDTYIKRYVLPKRTERVTVPEREYSFSDSLIHEVKILPWGEGYNYYADFYGDVKKYFSVEREEYAEPVQFFSYVPQYSHMDAAQKKRYFYFRTLARRGEFIDDISYFYILLYCFELLSSGELAEPSEVLLQLISLWRHYRRMHPRLNKYLSEWICDFGLLYGLTLPNILSSEELSELMRSSSLKEYYASGTSLCGEDFAEIIIEFCSAYNYRTSRYYADNREIYESFIGRALRELFDGGYLTGFTSEECEITRQLFVGAIAPCAIKKKALIEYCSFSRTNELRYAIGDVLKYCENKIRASLLIKSRLTVYDIDENVKKFIDSLSERLLHKKQPARARTEKPPEYERLYDAPKREFSLDRAKRIESESWSTTELLVEAFSEDASDFSADLSAGEDISPKKCDAVISPPPKNGGGDESADVSPLAEYREFLSLALTSDAQGQRRYARERGVMPEYVADEINRIGAELYGDVLIEEADGVWRPIEDYLALIEKEVKNDG